MVRTARTREGADPWARAPTDELQDQVLPRWFVLLAVVLVPVAAVVAVLAFLVTGTDEVALGARRPPPAGGLTSAVGALEAVEAPTAPLRAPCPLLRGVRVAGPEEDRSQLRAALGVLCDVDVTSPTRAALQDFAGQEGVVAFAAFRDSGVASTARIASGEPLTVYVNRRFRETDPRAIAPLLVHDAVVRAGTPGSVDTALDARRAELAVCDQLRGRGLEASRSCTDATALLDLDDPGAELRAAGYGDG